MREMKDSGIEWIGQIPKGWDVVPHKRVMHKVKEICEQYNGEDIISLTMNGVIKRDLTAGGKMPTSFDGYQYVKPNDLLLCLFDIDVTPRCVGVVKDYGVTSPAYSRFVMHDGYYNAYYDYLLRAIDDDKVFVHLSKNLRSSLTESDFGAIKTCVPSLAEQKRIVTFLDAQCAEIDAVLEKTRASIEEYKKLKQAVITQAVTKGIRGDRPMKDSGIEWIGEIPAEWGVAPHKRIMHKVKEICEQYNGEDVISLTVNGVVKRDLTAGGKMPTSFDGYQYVEPNDLLLCLFDIDVTPRCVGVVRDYGVTSPAYSRFVMHDGYYNAYYDYLLRMIDDNKVFVHLSKNLRSSLTESDFGAIKTCAPPLAEQKCIAAFLDVRCDEIDALIAKKQQYLTEIENYKKSLIYEYVTGKKEVHPL